jgi:C4-dicarboxylate transporter, DctM subunit
VVIAICVIYLIMGCVFDSLAMLILTVPIFAAILKPMGVDMVWFGIVVVIAVELGLITPPIGINVFVVKSSVPDVNVWTIFAGVCPLSWRCWWRWCWCWLCPASPPPCPA